MTWAGVSDGNVEMLFFFVWVLMDSATTWVVVALTPLDLCAGLPACEKSKHHIVEEMGLQVPVAV